VPARRVRRVCEEAAALVEMARTHADSHAVGVTPLRARGIGLEWEDYRDYQPGDDFRLIDWRLSGRAIGPEGGMRILVRERRAERRLEVVLALDASLSMEFGEKLHAALYALSFMASLARWLSDVTTLLVLGPERPSVIRLPPSELALAAVHEICETSGVEGRVDLRDVARAATSITSRRASLVLITDLAHDPGEFEDLASSLSSAGWGLGLALSSHPSEVSLPPGGAAELVDPEAGPVRVDGVREWGALSDRLAEHRALAFAALRRWAVPHVEFVGLEGCRAAAPSLAWLYHSAREGAGRVRAAIAGPG